MSSFWDEVVMCVGEVQRRKVCQERRVCLIRAWNQHFCGFGREICENFGDRGERGREKMERRVRPQGSRKWEV